MKKIIGEIASVLKRLFEANLNLEHYWFFPKTVIVPVKRRKYLKQVFAKLDDKRDMLFGIGLNTSSIENQASKTFKKRS